MSAQYTTQGMFKNISIDSIEIGIIKKEDDNIIKSTKYCLKIENLLNNVLNLEPFRSKIDVQLYKYLEKNTNLTINSFWNVFELYDTLNIEYSHNLTLPDWTKIVFPGKFEEQSSLYYSSLTYTTDLERLQVGLLWNNITSHLKHVISEPNAAKVLFFSGHENTITNVLNSIAAFDDHPFFSASIILELRQNSSKQFYVQAYLKNSTDFIKIRIRNCSFECNISEMISILAPITLSPEEWDHECNPDGFPKLAIFIICAVVLLSIILGFSYYNCKVYREGFRAVPTHIYNKTI